MRLSTFASVPAGPENVWSRSVVANNWWAIEGMMGAGKSTLLALLSDTFLAKGFTRVVILQEPLEKFGVPFALLENNAPEAAVIMQLYVLAWGVQVSRLIRSNPEVLYITEC